MLDQIRYSDRYAVDRYEGEWFGMGRADLPTFNPEPQPSVRNEATVFFQGDIVNKDSLLGAPPNLSNADIIAQQYAFSGVGFVNRLHGHFTTAIWDSNKESLFLINDRFGKHQMYLWSPAPQTLFFACEIKSIIPIARNFLRPNIQGIIDFLQFQYLLGDETYFENISLLPYASVLQFDKDGLRIRKYWSPKIGTITDSSSKYEKMGKLHDLVSVAISRATRGHSSRVGLLLSGGLDTRNIAAHMPRSVGSVHSFTYGKPDDEDTRLARLVAEERGFSFHFIPVTSKVIPDFAATAMWLLEGNATIMTAQNMVILEEAERNGIDIILDGISGNRIFGIAPRLPYPLFTFALLSVPYLGSLMLRVVKKSFSAEECFLRISESLGAIKEDDVVGILSDEFARRARPLIGESLRRVIREASSENSHILDIIAFVGLTQVVRRYHVNTQNCCRWRIEFVEPFVDYDLVDFTMKLPHKYKLWRRLVVEEMAAFHPSLIKIPLHGHSLPATATNVRIFIRMVARRIPLIKRLATNEPIPINGFAHFLRKQSSYFEKILSDERAISRGLFNLEKIRALFDEHMSGKASHTSVLYRLISLELWFRMVEDRYKLKIFHI